MGAARLAFMRMPQVGFWKLCGSGTGQGFTPKPNFGVWAILATWPDAATARASVDTAPVLANGPLIEHHPAFPNRVNAGFMQILNRDAVRLRVFERGAGETLACGTGACAAVVAGIRMGLLNPTVDVQTHGGTLTIEWQGLAKNDLSQAVFMTGPATSVFEGEIDVPNLP